MFGKDRDCNEFFKFVLDSILPRVLNVQQILRLRLLFRLLGANLLLPSEACTTKRFHSHLLSMKDHCECIESPSEMLNPRMSPTTLLYIYIYVYIISCPTTCPFCLLLYPLNQIYGCHSNTACGYKVSSWQKKHDPKKVKNIDDTKLNVPNMYHCLWHHESALMAPYNDISIYIYICI